MDVQFRFPDSSHRQFICGRTGSGKTVAACWNLLHRNFRSAPWIVLNHKGTALIDDIEGAEHVDLDFYPKKPGIYIYHPVPENDDEYVTKLFWKMLARGNVGLYEDEGYMINARDPGQRALLTQGREKKIPIIIATQRPVALSRFAVSEADFFQVFQLNDDEDIKRVRGFIPFDLKYWMKTEANEVPKLGQHCSIWYDVSRNNLVKLEPVPPESKILEKFYEALKPQESRKRIFI